MQRHTTQRKAAGQIRRAGLVRMLGMDARLAANDEGAQPAADRTDNPQQPAAGDQVQT